MYRLAIISSFLFISSSLFAGTINGKVIDSPTGEIVEYATIKLMSQLDSSLVTGAVSNDAGFFILKDIPYGKYFIEVNFIGYDMQTINNVELSSGAPTFDAGTLSMVPSSELEQVDVVSEIPIFQNKIDKKVFNASESDIGKGGTGLDLMKVVPLVTVDENDNILLRGDGNVTIFIDGRPSAIPASDLLKQIPGTSIDRVELITNPSAKYDPEGMSGIINIILKKEKFVGFNGSVSSSFGYGKFSKTNNSLTLNYRNKKINISSRIGYSHRRTWFGGLLQRNVLLGDTLWDILKQEDYGERINSSVNVKIGFDYFINDKNTVYLNVANNSGTNDGSRLVEYTNVDELDNKLAYSARNGRIDSPNDGFTYNGGWQKTFKKQDHTLDVDLNISTYDRVGDERLAHEYYDENDVFYFSEYQNTLATDKFNTYLGKIDYTLPITDSMEFEAGFHYTNRFADNEFYSESGLEDGNLIADVGLNNKFNYLQVTYASYMTFSKQFKKIGAKIGLRAEQTETEANLITTQDYFSNDYFKLFPSFHLNYKLGEFSEVQFSYSKRINRPQRRQLNPFTNYSDPLVLETGNPFLLPEVIHVNELSYMKFWKKFNINASIYHRLITNLIRRGLSYEGTQSLVTYSNLGQSSLSGSDLILTYKPRKGVRIMSTTNVWNTATKDIAFTDGTMTNYFGLSTSLSASAQLGKGWSFQLWGSYSPRQKVLQGAVVKNYGGGMAIAKSMLKKKGRLTFSFVDVFKTRQFGFEAYSTGSYTFSSYRKWESRRVYVNFNYTFGKIVQSKNKRTNKNIDSSDDKSVPDMQ